MCNLQPGRSSAPLRRWIGDHAGLLSPVDTRELRGEITPSFTEKFVSVCLREILCGTR